MSEKKKKKNRKKTSSKNKAAKKVQIFDNNKKKAKKEITKVNKDKKEGGKYTKIKGFSKELSEIIEKSGGKEVLEKIVKKNKEEKEALMLVEKLKAAFDKSVVFLKSIIPWVLAIAAFAMLIVGIEMYMNNRVLPRTAFAGEEISFNESSNLEPQLTQSLNDYLQANLTFVLDGDEMSVAIKDLGIEIDVEATLNKIPYFHLKQANLPQLIASIFSRSDFYPIYNYDQDQVYTKLEYLFRVNDFRSKSARLAKNEDGEIIIKEAERGLKINKDSLKSRLNNRIDNLSNEPITIELVDEEPVVLAEDLEKISDDLTLRVENTIQIKYGNESWGFKPMDYLDQLIYRKVEDEIIISVSGSLLNGYFTDEIFNQVKTDVSDLKIFYNDNDEIAFEGQALNGKQVNIEKFISDLELALNSIDQEVELSLDQIDAQINIDERLQKLGIKEMLGTGHTAFAGSPSNRRHNIVTGMNKFNGLLIKPGEVFSFNDNLGPVDGSTGYKLELVIKAEGTVPEYGGGICQVSSTMFKAGIFSGLPIVERSPHSYAVGYYAQIDGYGLDATIYPGVKDLKLENNTEGHVLIQTVVEGNDAYIHFFGTSDGRKVRLENYWRGNYRSAGGTQLIPTTTLAPGARKQIESAHGGFDASWDRIMIKDGIETTENIYSVYRATSNRILVGEERSAPAE